MRISPTAAFQPALCAGTDYECDCDCKCPKRRYESDPSTYCNWPDCGCGCDVACIGCDLARENLDA